MPTEPASCMAVTGRHVEMANVGFDVEAGLQGNAAGGSDAGKS